MIPSRKTSAVLLYLSKGGGRGGICNCWGLRVVAFGGHFYYESDILTEPEETKYLEAEVMHMLATDYPHINVTPDGVPMLAGTKTKLIEVALDRLAHYWDVDEIHRQHPHLTRGQICSALAYYYDHQDELDQAIQAQLSQVDAIKAGLGPALIQEKLIHPSSQNKNERRNK